MGYRASPWKLCTPPPVEICTPLQNQGVVGTCCLLALSSRPPSRQPKPAQLARDPGNKRLKKSDNFSPQLDLIFFFDAPTAGGRIAGEEQVRQEKCDFREAWWRHSVGFLGAGAHALAGAGNWGLFCTDRKANDYA